MNLPVEDGDGHEWTVSEDWEVRVGMAHDILGITEEAEEAWALGQS